MVAIFARGVIFFLLEFTVDERTPFSAPQIFGGALTGSVAAALLLLAYETSKPGARAWSDRLILRFSLAVGIVVALILMLGRLLSLDSIWFQ